MLLVIDLYNGYVVICSCHIVQYFTGYSGSGTVNRPFLH